MKYGNPNFTNSVGLELPFVALFRAVLAYRRGVLSSLCPGLFPGVTPFRRAGGAHVVPETPGLHIPVF